MQVIQHKTLSLTLNILSLMRYYVIMAITLVIASNCCDVISTIIIAIFEKTRILPKVDAQYETCLVHLH